MDGNSLNEVHDCNSNGVNHPTLAGHSCVLCMHSPQHTKTGAQMSKSELWNVSEDTRGELETLDVASSLQKKQSVSTQLETVCKTND